MYSAGAATVRVIIESPVEDLDANGAPTRTWLEKRNAWAEVDGGEYSVSESLQSPYEQNTRALTLKLRNSVYPSTQINIRDRVKTTTWIGAITAVRYSRKRDIIWIDVQTGNSDG